MKNGADDDALLDVEGLSVAFRGSTAVKSVSFHVNRGETLAIVGESGSGKSVTSLAIMRLVEFAGGRIANGAIRLRRSGGATIDLATASEREMLVVRGSEVAMIFQEPMTSLNPVFTVGAQITEALLLHRDLTASAARAEARRILDRVRIPDAGRIMGRYPHELSGGMRQRVMIAIAICCRPALLIADEPTTALDVTIQSQIIQLIKELQREMNMGVMFISHDMGVVSEVADRVLVMRHGAVVETNTSISIFEDPRAPYTQALLAAVPRLGDMRGTEAPRKFPLLGAAAEAGRPALAANPQSSRDRNLLRVRDLVTRFDINPDIVGRPRSRVHAVENVSFDLGAGETLSLVGESGCGKTTTGRSLLNLARRTSGTIELEGQLLDPADRTSLARMRRNMQIIFQDPFASLNPRMRVGESVKEPMLIHRTLEGAAADRRVAELLERVGLNADAARRWPHEFSGGQRQRICIARALSVGPKIVIADEAVSALDVSIQAQVVNLLIELQEELGVSYLFISHDMAVVERISHRVAVMYLGRIVEIGPRRAIFENPRHPYTRKLMQAVPVADPRHRPQRALDVSELPSPVRPIDFVPEPLELVEVEPGHLVAMEHA